MKVVSVASVLVILLPFLIVITLAYVYAADFLISYLHGYNFLRFGYAIAIVSLILLTFPLAFLVFTFTPFGLSKNLPFIHWLFLSGIYKTDGRWPQATYKWLKREG